LCCRDHDGLIWVFTFAGICTWEHHYNWRRFSTALKGETPGEKLQRLLPGICAA
jgi:hypothetical protein